MQYPMGEIQIGYKYLEKGGGGRKKKAQTRFNWINVFENNTFLMIKCK